MSRKEFLGQTGAVLLAVIGVSSVLHALNNTHAHKSLTGSVASGYGSSPYGGQIV